MATKLPPVAETRESERTVANELPACCFVIVSVCYVTNYLAAPAFAFQLQIATKTMSFCAPISDFNWYMQVGRLVAMSQMGNCCTLSGAWRKWARRARNKTRNNTKSEVAGVGFLFFFFIFNFFFFKWACLATGRCLFSHLTALAHTHTHMDTRTLTFRCCQLTHFDVPAHEKTVEKKRSKYNMAAVNFTIRKSTN